MVDKSVRDLDSNRNWTISLNTKIIITNMAPYRKIYVSNVLVAEYINGDHFNEALALVTIIKNGAMNISDLAESFEFDRRTLYNYINAYEADGLEGLRPSKNYRGKINNEIISFIRKFQNNNIELSYVELNRALSKNFNVTISENTIRKLIRAELVKPLKNEFLTPGYQLTFENIDDKDTIVKKNELFQHATESVVEDECEASTYTRYGGYLIYSTMIQTLFKETFQYVEKNLSCKNSLKTWFACPNTWEITSIGICSSNNLHANVCLLWGASHNCHSFATMMLSQGESLKVTSELLGHSTVKTTGDIYSHVLDNVKRNAAIKIDNVILGIQEANNA